MPDIDGFKETMVAPAGAPQSIENSDVLADDIGEETDGKLQKILEGIQG